SLRPPSPSYVTSSALPPPRQNKKITGDELSARAKANSYQKSVYRNKVSLRDRRECYVCMAEVHTSDCQKDFMRHQTFLSIRARLCFKHALKMKRQDKLSK